MNKLFIVFVLCVSGIAAQPQRFFDPYDPNNFGRQQQQQQQRRQQQFPFPGSPQFDGSITTTTTTASPNAVTTASPEYLACLQACPVTSEYNPICGSDNINYHNNGRLNCAIRCGNNVVALRAGICPTNNAT